MATTIAMNKNDDTIYVPAEQETAFKREGYARGEAKPKPATTTRTADAPADAPKPATTTRTADAPADAPKKENTK